jgi:hypothetical protein
MRTLRITLIFAVLALGLSFVVNTLYTAFKPIGLAQGIPPTDPIVTLIPIACGLVAAPFTLRINRWIEQRMRDEKKKKI